MSWFSETLDLSTHGKGLYPITQLVEGCVSRWGINEGMCFLFIPHTSASLVISENYDPSARADLEAFIEQLVPESQPWHRHTLEGPDDSPSHMRAMLTQTSLVIPIDRARLSLGTWQGIYVFEHRTQRQRRQVYLRCLSVP